MFRPTSWIEARDGSWRCPLVAKVASTTLCATAAGITVMDWQSPGEVTDAAERAGLRRLFATDDAFDFSAHGVSFAVWRNPVSRALSVYRQFCVDPVKPSEAVHYYRLLGLVGAGLDRWIDYIEFELGKTNPSFQDSHVRRQCDCYTLDRVRWVVPIGELANFATEVLGMELPKVNESTLGKEDHAAPAHISRLNSIYSADYAMERMAMDCGKYWTGDTNTGDKTA